MNNMVQRLSAGEGLINNTALAELKQTLPDLSNVDRIRAFPVNTLRLNPDSTFVKNVDEVFQDGAVSVSGAPVLIALNESENTLAIVNFFPDDDEFVGELTAIHRLSQPDLSEVIQSPTIQGVGRTSSGQGVMVMFVAPGSAIDSGLVKLGELTSAGGALLNLGMNRRSPRNWNIPELEIVNQ